MPLSRVLLKRKPIIVVVTHFMSSHCQRLLKILLRILHGIQIQLLDAVTIHSFLQPTFQFRCVGSPQFQHPRVSKAVGSVDPTFHARPSALGATKPTCDDSAAIVEAAGSCLETRARVPSKRGSDSRACSGFLSAVIVLYLWPPC